jgi:hypothetical protein
LKKYQRIQQNTSANNKLIAVYNDLALRKERYNNLSANEGNAFALRRVTEKYNGIPANRCNNRKTNVT